MNEIRMKGWLDGKGGNEARQTRAALVSLGREPVEALHAALAGGRLSGKLVRRV